VAAALNTFMNESNSWQPIDTAPKDGTEILLLTGHGMKIGAWYDDFYSKKPKPYWTWWDYSKIIMRRNQPTHWQPLPKMPSDL
jgi:hypothetical protein